MFPKYKLGSRFTYDVLLFKYIEGIGNEWLYINGLSNLDYYVIPEGWVLWSTILRTRHFIDSERELIPSDLPVPGIGYKAMAASGQYIRHKFHHVYSESWSHTFIMGARYGPFEPYPLHHSDSGYLGLSWEALEDDEFLTTLRNKAVQNLYGSLARRKRLQVGVFLGELRETLGLLGSTLIDLIELYKAVKSGNLKKAYQVLRSRGVSNIPQLPNRTKLNKSRVLSGKKPLTPSEYAANAWLELQFGWMPLISDTHSIISLVQEKLSNTQGDAVLSFSGRSSGNRNVGSVRQLPTTHVPTSDRYEFHCTQTSHDEVQVEVIASFKIANNSLDYLNTLGLLNPATIAWNLAPLSFVIDWIFPVGAWLDSFTAFAGLELIQVTPSIKMQRSNVLTDFRMFDLWSESYDQAWDFEHIAVKQDISEFIRIPDKLHAVPPFPPRVSFGSILRPWTLITASALIKQLSR